VMRAQGGGMIINVVKLSPEAGRAAYAASQAAVAGLEQQAAAELGAYHVQLHTVTAGGAQPNPLQAVIDLCGPGPGAKDG
jgi:NAD(P)-dependent dehydrogenase (short-subunit alcohol dehydrogenase family)